MAWRWPEIGPPSTPGLTWNDVYPNLVRMFDLMQVPVQSRQVYLDQYQRWIGDILGNG